MSGKGDTPRPLSIPADDFAARWELTFGRQECKSFSLELLGRATDRLREEATLLREKPPEP